MAATTGNIEDKPLADEAAVPPQPEVEAAPPQPVVETTCHYCGKTCEKIDSCCINLKRDECKCKACNVTRVSLFRSGEFPDLSKLTKEEMTAFYLNCQNTNGQGKLELARQIHMSRVTTDFETYAEEGTFLPLTVWAAKGFDSASIERLSLPENIRTHPVLGVVYRVALETAGTKRKHGNAFQDAVDVALGSETSSPPTASNTSLADLIKKRQAEEKERKAKEKKLQQQLRNCLAPAKKALKNLQDIKGDIKMEKVPAMFLENNPIDVAVENLQMAIQGVDDFHNEESLATLTKEVENAKLVAKSMKTFT